MRTRYARRGARGPLSGFTLLEVMAVIVVIGLIAGLAALAFGTLRTPRESDTARELRRARSEAIETGHSVTTGGNRAERTHVLFLPDGRAVGSGTDPLTGAAVDSAR